MWEINHGIDRQEVKKLLKKPQLSITISQPVVTFQYYKVKNFVYLPANLSVPFVHKYSKYSNFFNSKKIDTT